MIYKRIFVEIRSDLKKINMVEMVSQVGLLSGFEYFGKKPDIP